MGLILLPLSQSSLKSLCFFSPFLSLPPPARPLCLPLKHFSLPLLPSFPLSFPPWWCHSLIKQQACFPLGGFMAGGSLSISLLHFPLSPLFSSLHFCPLVFLSLFWHLSLPLPPSVTTALEEMSFHGRFAAISKMAALPNGQLPWF